ncbi:hypothetical protein [Marinivivus vitaminiproducens]|uniref:hypothetical protein n=1 Tax=Marinivivus vitaminiproducens TaxID=3035935 RepID=UPI0027A0CED7|nr:hypothetical protein P4R82_14330 [Geminicoccaceae bacterium SCSIO 64248]
MSARWTRRAGLAVCAVVPTVALVTGWPWRSRPAFGYGPLRIGMSRPEAMAALGSGARPSPLCSGVEGVLFEWPDEALAIAEGRPVPVMAMLGGAGGAVSEIDVSLSRAQGGYGEGDWRALLVAETAEACRLAGLGPANERRDADAVATSVTLRFVRDEGTLALHARWMRRSGACFTRLHWLGRGTQSVIV